MNNSSIKNLCLKDYNSNCYKFMAFEMLYWILLMYINASMTVYASGWLLFIYYFYKHIIIK